MATRFSVDAVFSAIDKMTLPVKKMQTSTKAFSSNIKKDFAAAQRQAENLGSGFGNNLKRSVAIGIGAAIAGIGYLAKEGLDLASDLTEVQNVVDTTFGAGAKQINEWSKSAITKFGLSELQAKKFTGSLGAMLKSSGLAGNEIIKISTDMTGLAGDFASFYNLPIEEAFEKIRSGISGETEPLKQLGINMSVANMEAFALAQGITKKWKSMTQAEQAMLRYNYLMKVTADAQGDFSKTLETSLANQKRVLSTNFLQKLATIMTRVIPIATNGFQKLNAFVSSIDAEKIGRGIEKIVNFLSSFVSIAIEVLKIILPFAPIILTMVMAWMAYQKSLLAVAIVQKMFNSVTSMSPMARLVLIIGFLIGLILYLRNNWNSFNSTTKTWIKIAGTIIGIILAIIGAIKAWTIVQAILNIVMAMNPISLIIIAIAALIAIIILLIKNWDKVKNAFINAGRWMLNMIKELGKMIMRALLAPINLVLSGIIKLLQLASKIPGIGGKFKAAAEWAEGFKTSINSPFIAGSEENKGGPAVTTQRETVAAAFGKGATTNRVVIENQSNNNVRSGSRPIGTGTSLKLQPSG